MNSEILENRLKSLAFRVIPLCETFPKTQVAFIIQKQIIRSAFSAAANYRAATKAISKRAFVSKLSIAFEESDETLFWLESIRELNLAPLPDVEILLKEAKELSSILAASRKTAQKKLANLQS
jgi:four helix bundle protein